MKTADRKTRCWESYFTDTALQERRLGQKCCSEKQEMLKITPKEN